MIQLAVALGTVTIVTVTGVDSILGLGPAVFLVAGALAVGPAGRISDRLGRMPVIRSGFVLGIVGPLVTAGGCARNSGVLVFLGLAALALSWGVVYTGAGGSVPLAVAACGLAFLAAAWVAGNGSVLLPSAAAGG